MEKSEIVDVERIVEQGKALLTGEAAILPKSAEEIKSTLENIGSEVEQVRYAEAERLSATGQAILKDLEEILVGGAEVTEAIPSETFLHAARAQQKAAEVAKGEAQEAAEITETVAMNAAKLVRMLFTSGEFREAVSDWTNWLKDVLIIQLKESKPEAKVVVEEEEQQQQQEEEEEEEEKEIGQVPTGPVEGIKSFTEALPPISDDQIDKLIELLEWVEERQEYQEAIGYVFDRFGRLTEPAGDIRVALEEAKATGLDTLKAIENWTQLSVEPFKTHLLATGEALKTDEKLRTALQSLTHFLSNCFNEPGFLNDRRWIRMEARDQLEQVRAALKTGGYQEYFSGLMDESRDLIKALDKSPRTAHLKDSFRKLLEDLFIGDQDQPSASFRFKTELINDIGVIVSGLLQRAKYLKLPDLEIHDDDLDFRAHNIILDAAELVPQQFKVTLVTENELLKAKREKKDQPPWTDEEKERVFVERMPPFKAEQPTGIPAITVSGSPWQTFLKFEVKGIHGHCRNVHFNVRKRTGFPQLTDEGLADLRVWGPKGMLIKIVLKPELVHEERITKTVETSETIETSSSAGVQVKTEHVLPRTEQSAAPSQRFKLKIVKAHCDIDELDLELHGTRRDWFYTVLGPMVRKRVKTALESSIERNLLTLMD